MNEYFTIEDCKNPKENPNTSESAHEESDHNNATTAYYVENVGVGPFHKRKTIKSSKRPSNKGKSFSSAKHSGKKSRPKKTMCSKYMVNYSTMKPSSRKRSSHKIIPYKRPNKVPTAKSEKRPLRANRLNNTGKIKLEDKESFLISEKMSQNDIDFGSNLGVYDKELYDPETSSSRNYSTSKRNSFTKGILSRTSISPKRMSGSKRQRIGNITKPPIKVK